MLLSRFLEYSKLSTLYEVIDDETINDDLSGVFHLTSLASEESTLVFNMYKILANKNTKFVDSTTITFKANGSTELLEDNVQSRLDKVMFKYAQNSTNFNPPRTFDEIQIIPDNKKKPIAYIMFRNITDSKTILIPCYHNKMQYIKDVVLNTIGDTDKFLCKVFFTNNKIDLEFVKCNLYETINRREMCMLSKAYMSTPIMNNGDNVFGFNIETVEPITRDNFLELLNSKFNFSTFPCLISEKKNYYGREVYTYVVEIDQDLSIFFSKFKTFTKLFDIKCFPELILIDMKHYNISNIDSSMKMVEL